MRMLHIIFDYLESHRNKLLHAFYLSDDVQSINMDDEH